MNNLPKVVTQQRRGRASNPRLLNRKSDALPLSHRATPKQRGCAMLRVIECFKSLKITQDHSRSFEMTPLNIGCVDPYMYVPS